MPETGESRVIFFFFGERREFNVSHSEREDGRAWEMENEIPIWTPKVFLYFLLSSRHNVNPTFHTGKPPKFLAGSSGHFQQGVSFFLLSNSELLWVFLW